MALADRPASSPSSNGWISSAKASAGFYGLAALQPGGLGGLAVVEAGGLRAWIAELDASRLGGSQSGLGADAVVIGAVDLPRMNLVMAGGAQGYQVSLVFAAALGTGDNVVVLQVVLRMSPSMAALSGHAPVRCKCSLSGGGMASAV